MKTTLLVAASIIMTIGLNAQIDNGIVAHFPFNGDHNDISSSSITGVNSGTTFGPDRNSSSNNALALNGSQFYGFNSSDVKVNLPLTIAAWVNLNANSGNNLIFTSDTDFDNYAGYWFQTVGATNQPAISFGGDLGGLSSGNRRSFLSDMSLQTGVWYHIVAIIRAHNDMEIYVDCAQTTGVYSGSGPTSIGYTTASSKIGVSTESSTNPQGVFYDGLIDQLVIWDREITSSEISFMCDLNNTLAIPVLDKTPKKLVKIVNMMGQETEFTKNTPLFYLYSDGSTEKILVVD